MEVVGGGGGDSNRKPWSIGELGRLTQAAMDPRLDLALDIPAVGHPSLFRPPPDPSSSSSSASSSPSSSPSYHSEGRKLMRGPMRRRMCWTPKLHMKFVDAVNQLGIGNAVPKSILKLMNVEGLTRDSVASHLQKYRHYLRVKGMDGEICSASSTTDRPLAKDGLMPYQFLTRRPPEEAELPRSDGSIPYQFLARESPVASLHHHSRHLVADQPIANASVPYRFLACDSPAGAELSTPDVLAASGHYHSRLVVADRPFANASVPYRFLAHGSSAGAELYTSDVLAASLHHYQQLLYNGSRQVWHLGVPNVDREVNHGFQNETLHQYRRWQGRSLPWAYQMAGQAPALPPSTTSWASRGERTMLKLFPTGED